VDFFRTRVVVNVKDMCLSKITISQNLIGRKKAHDRPCSLLFSFYQLKQSGIETPSGITPHLTCVNSMFQKNVKLIAHYRERWCSVLMGVLISLHII